MDNNAELTVFRARSSRRVISAGYMLYMSHFRKILKSSWIVAVFYALCMGLLGNYYISEIPRFTVMLMNHMANDGDLIRQSADTSLIMLLLILLHFAVYAVMISYGFSACKEHQETNSISAPSKWYGQFNRAMVIKTFKGFLWLIPVACVLTLIIGGIDFLALKYLGKITAYVAIAVFSVLGLIVLLPFVYIQTKYILTPKANYLKMFASAYSTSLRYLGSMFIVILVVGIITAILLIVVQLPANILYVANLQSQLGILQGDPLGMPAYMEKLNFVVFALMGFIQAYIQLSTLFPYYYLYGSIEKQEEERKNLRLDTYRK